MKIIYAYNKDPYAAYKAAYIRLKLDFILAKKIKIDFEKKLNPTKPYYLGIDEDFNEIYIINYGKNPTIFKNTIEGLCEIYGEEIKVILLN